jgi:hypothetical protein
MFSSNETDPLFIRNSERNKEGAMKEDSPRTPHERGQSGGLAGGCITEKLEQEDND